MVFSSILLTIVLVQSESQTWYTWAGSLGHSDEIGESLGALDPLESVLSENREVLISQVEQIYDCVVIIHFYFLIRRENNSLLDHVKNSKTKRFNFLKNKG